MNGPDVGYLRLALALLMQAIQDACARRTTNRVGSFHPTPQDVRSAREFLASPAAEWLAAQLGLSLEDVRRRVDIGASSRKAKVREESR